MKMSCISGGEEMMALKRMRIIIEEALGRGLITCRLVVASASVFVMARIIGKPPDSD